jgi:hypothetical protein
MVTAMKSEIEKSLAVIVGKPLAHSRRAADMQMFDFGALHDAVNRKGFPIQRAEYALHVQCPWRIVASREIVVGSEDVYDPPAEQHPPDSDFISRHPEPSRRDERLESFFAEGYSSVGVVEGVEADDVGSLSVYFSGGAVLELFPCESPGAEYADQWSFFRPGADQEHLVVTAKGMERVSPSPPS